MSEKTTKVRCVRPLPLEELVPGMYVATMRRVVEFVPIDAICSSYIEPTTKQVTLWTDNAPRPLKVVDVCLPMVLVRRPDGKHQLLDVRRVQLVRVSKRFALKVFELLPKRPKPADEKACATSTAAD